MSGRQLRSSASVAKRKPSGRAPLVLRGKPGKRGCETDLTTMELADLSGRSARSPSTERRVRRVVRKVKTEEGRRWRKILRCHREEVDRIVKEEILDGQEDVRGDFNQLQMVWDEKMSDRESKCSSSLMRCWLTSIGRWAIDLLEAMRCNASIWDEKCVVPLCPSKRRHNTGQCLWMEAAMSRYPEYEVFGLERLQVPMKCMDCRCSKRMSFTCEHCKLECYCARRQFVVQSS
jgi:hypothetical protein